MSFNIKLKPKASTGTCSIKATLDYNTWQVFPEGTAGVIDPLAANPIVNALGDVTIAIEGCDDVVIRYEQYESGDTDCTNCPPSTAVVPSLVVKYAYIPAGSSITLPQYITDFDFVAIDVNVATGVPETDYAAPIPTRDDLQIYVASCRTVDACCPFPGTTNGRGVVIPGDIEAGGKKEAVKK